jgi:hypothetical protein
LTGKGFAELVGANVPTLLTNVDNNIVGAGAIGAGGYLGLLNEAAGVINANQTGALTLNFTSGDLVNAGLIEATSTVAGNGGLVLASTTVNNSGGTVSATGTNAHVDLVSGVITGGTLISTGGGIINVIGAGGLDGMTSGTLVDKASVRITNGSALSLYGTIANSATIGLQASTATTALLLASPVVTLTGGGFVQLSNNANNMIAGNLAGNTLVNLDNTIAGGGRLGASQMTLANSGTINANTGNALTIDTGAQDMSNTATGLLEATGSGGLILANGVVSNIGTILAGDGSRVTFQVGVTNTNNDDGTLVGGTWEALSSGKGALVSITGGPVTADAATIIMSGTNSVFRAGDGAAFTNLEASLGTIVAGGTLEVLGSRNYTTGLSLTDSGLLQLSGGTLTTGGLSVTAGTVIGSGAINTKTVTNAGTIESAGGTLVVAGTIASASSGIFLLGNASVLEIGADQGSANRMSFLGSGQLTVDHASQFGIQVGTASYAGPLLQNFGPNDKVLLADILAAGLTPNFATATGVLQISNGTTSVASLAFDTASLGAGAFHITADPLGHALIIHT